MNLSSFSGRANWREPGIHIAICFGLMIGGSRSRARNDGTTPAARPDSPPSRRRAPRWSRDPLPVAMGVVALVAENEDRTGLFYQR